jgi:hypothetical protein
MDIWYVYEQADGRFAGSGTPHFDDDVYGSTLTPTPEYGEDQIPVWNGDGWDVVDA